MEDITRQELKYRRLMVGADLLARQWRSMFGRGGGERIGVLLPNLNATPVVLLSLWAANKVPAVLNFSTGTPTMLACVELAGLRHVITSRAFLERAKLSAEPFVQAGVEITYLEDVPQQISGREARRISATLTPHSALRTRILPAKAQP